MGIHLKLFPFIVYYIIISYLGTYFNCIMFMVASSVVSTILILNYHHRNADTHEMADWVREVFVIAFFSVCWLPFV